MNPSDSIPTFAYRQDLAQQQLDTALVPVSQPVAWLVLTAATFATFPEEVELAIQVRFGAGPWLLFTTPVAFSALLLKQLGCPPHGGGINIRTPAASGLQLIAQGGG